MAALSASQANGTAAKRIRKEITDLARENLGSITLTPNESNIFHWHAQIPGPTGSPYEGGVFEVDIRVPDDYPFSPPRLCFMTKVYHCNIAPNGAICLDLLKNAWSPALSLYKVILSLSSLLTDPNPADPLVPAIAQEYKRNRHQHDSIAREWVKLYAMPKPATPQPPPPTSAPTSAPTSRSSSARPSRGTVRRNVDTATPPPSVLGTRRRGGGDASNAIELSDDEGDVQVVGESSATTGSSSAAPNGLRRSKRGRQANDDVIVIDD